MKEIDKCYICGRKIREDQWVGDPDGDYMCWWCAFHDGYINNADYRTLKNKDNDVMSAPKNNNHINIQTKLIHEENDGKKK